MKTILKIASAVLSVFLITGCGQDTVDSSAIAPAYNQSGGTSGSTAGAATNNIDRDYDLIAKQNSSEVSFLATFRMAGTWGTTIRLSSPAQLVFDGQKLADSEVISKEGATIGGMILPIFSPFLYLASGTHYHGRSSGVRSFEIQFTDQRGHTYIDHMSVYPCSFLTNPAVLSKSQSSTWSVQSAGGSATRVSASLGQSKSDGSYASASAMSGGGSFAFATSDLAKLEPGVATLKVECETETVLDANASGKARGSSRYEIETSVTVVP